MYTERRSAIAGSVVWARTDSVGETDCRIVPDGCMDLIVLREQLVIAGPDTGPHLSTPSPGATFIGLRLAPGTGPAVFGVPAYTLRNLRVPLDAVWQPAAVQRLQDRLGAGGQPGVVLEVAVTERLQQVPGPEPALAAVVRALRTGCAVAAAAAAVGFSERQLRRRSLDAFGYGPKTLGRILRMQRAVERVRTGMSFAEAAARTGYADQAHMAREIKDLSGVPLSELLGYPGRAANRSTGLPSGSLTTA